jgi:hypothetical protein
MGRIQLIQQSVIHDPTRSMKGHKVIRYLIQLLHVSVEVDVADDGQKYNCPGYGCIKEKSLQPLPHRAAREPHKYINKEQVFWTSLAQRFQSFTELIDIVNGIEKSEASAHQPSGLRSKRTMRLHCTMQTRSYSDGGIAV